MARTEIQFPQELPISSRVLDIAKAIDAHPVVIVAGATGSGKTTQLPKIALAMGRGVSAMIGVTQPRRLAATSTAARVATELDTPLGTDVGYQIRFDDKTSPLTYVKFMTDGILLAEIKGDPYLRRYDTIVIDEAHERSLTIDFLLGWVKRILPQRPDLKVIVSSATIETERFSEFFGGAPVVQVEGRTYPVDVLYEPPDQDLDLAEAVGNAVANVTSLDPRGDILVFLPGEREIREAENDLRARDLRHTVIQPLYARLSSGEQSRVFTSIPQRRVILATNVAETSITIPGIVYVVDTGVARLSRYEPRSGTTTLQIEAISRASADQRKGRCGRVRDGVCVRLYDEQSFEARPAFTDPEIKRTGLAGVILRMKSLGLGDVEEFPFLDPPSSRSISEGYRVLEELGAIGEKRELTELGHRLARFPVDPRIGRMILAGADKGCLADVLVVAAALSVQDPRERPLAAQQKADEMHRRFRDERSDFVGYLRLWDFIREADAKGRGELRRVCQKSFLSFLRVREWLEVHRQLEQVMKELRVPMGGKSGDTDALHRALLTGLLARVGQWHPEHRVYLGAKQTRFSIHPSSSVARKPPAWIMAFELVETSQLFARTVAKVEPEWLEQEGAHLLKRSYSDPHWAEKPARVSVKEHATLFGLPVTRDKSVDYANIAPLRARLMFLDHALVRGEYTSRGKFQEKNRALLADVARLRDKARRSDMLADDTTLLSFFDARVPHTVVNGKTFEAWREEAEKSDKSVLHLSMADVLMGDNDLRAADFPDEWTIHGTTLSLGYRFDPSLADEDGVTVTVPLPLVPQLDARELDGIVPGLHKQKIAALLDELPRALRRELAGARELETTVARVVRPLGPRYVHDVAEAVRAETGVELTEESFRLDAIPPYLQLIVRVVGEDGRELARGRNARDILERLGALARVAWKGASRADTWEKQGLVAWTFGDLAEHVESRVGGVVVRSFPSIVDRGSSVDLVIAESRAIADASTRAGIRRLVWIAARPAISAIEPRIPDAFPLLDDAPAIKGARASRSRAESDSFRRDILNRIVDESFELGGEPVRRKSDFDSLVVRGIPRVPPVFRAWVDLLAAARSELERTLAALQSASQSPSGRAAVVEIRAQLAEIFSPELAKTISQNQLRQLPRYLRAAKTRLDRAIADPRKDAEKLSAIAPLWKAFLAKRVSLRDVEGATEVRWSFEELRVSIFAPELKTPSPVSAQKIAQALAALR